MIVKCSECGKKETLTVEKWRCDCGGAWEASELPDFDPGKINQNDFSIWRYGFLLGLDIQAPEKRMGVGWTPLVPIRIYDQKCYLKLEYLSPSGSFKDRGVNTMVNQLVHMDVKTIVEDSSGNAGASVAAHAARFGLEAQIYVPENASQTKKHQIQVYGAAVKAIQGSRRDVERAAQASITPSRAYSSHAYHPAYLVGQMTAAYELWEQLGHQAPDWIFCPVGQGGYLLGYWFGFRNLLAACMIKKMPRLVAVQAEKIAPIYHAFRQDLKTVPERLPDGATLAEGVSISKPVRGKRILQALYETNGRVLIASEEEIQHAQAYIAGLGFDIEPTSALVIAGFHQLMHEIHPDESVVLPLTGNGLKGNPNSAL